MMSLLPRCGGFDILFHMNYEAEDEGMMYERKLYNV